jgi:pimeloyl-ACP methyl ester carboxylesterase
LGRTSEKRGIQWQNCSIFNETSNDPNLACAYYEVPLDYNDPKAGKARLAVAKYAATAPKLGTLFVNPGGPGGSGVDFVTTTGKELSSIFWGKYDIVSWDPRGVGAFTTPGAVTCFDTADESAAFFQNSIVQTINYTITERFGQEELSELASTTEASSDLLIEFGRRCQKGAVGKFLQYVGTSSTIRDLVALGDCIVGQGKPIDFWGFSYGTVIGINFLNMFPERAGHVILDGVVDPESWVTYKLARPTLADADKTYAAFADACAQAGKARCKLLEFLPDGAQGPDVVRLLDDAHDTAVQLLRAGYTGLPVSPADMTTILLETLATPSTWSDFANGPAFQLLLLICKAAKAKHIPFNGNQYISLGVLPPVGFAPSPGGSAQTSFSSQAIIGADNSADVGGGAGAGGIAKRNGGGYVVGMKDVLSEVASITQSVSPTFGGNWGTGYNFGWPVRSVEPLPPFDLSATGSPVLVIGNTADPRTAFSGAQNAATLLGGRATLVEQLGVGHTSLAEVSKCTLNIIATYVVDSKLPDVPCGQHVTCEVDPRVLFPPLGNSSTPKRALNLLIGKRS